MNRSLKKSAGFTLLEIMITIGIIVILAVVLLAVGSNIRTKAQISATKTQLKALEGIIEQFEKDNSTPPPLTYFDCDGSGSINLKSTTPTFIDVLYRYPATKDQLVNLFGDKIKTNGTPSYMYVIDSFGNPISYVPENGVAWGFTAAPREYLRTAGPDKTIIDNNENAPQNLDDILSTEASH